MKTPFQKLLLTHAVLASTLFVTPGTHANQIINTPLNNVTEVTNGASNNTIEITSLGSITNKNLTAVNINSVGGNLIIDKNNINNDDAILITGATATNGIFFSDNHGTLIINAKSGIDNQNINKGSNLVFINDANATIVNEGTVINQGAGNNIFINGSDAIIDNKGSILNVSGATAIFVNDANARINNHINGIIQNQVAATSPTIQVEDFGLTLKNSGLIDQKSPNNTIFFDDVFSSLINEPDGVISQTGGGAAKFAILVTGGGTGDILNRHDATISATKVGGVGIGITTNNYDGSLINNGQISTIDFPGILVNANVSNTIVNAPRGNITQSASTVGAIFAGTTNVQFEGGLLNEGTISSLGGNAIDLGTKSAFCTFTQESGSITGNVLLAARDSAGNVGLDTVFVMKGGTIVGNVIAKTSGGVQNELKLNGGVIAGTVQLGDNGDTVQLNATNIVGILAGGDGDDTFNVRGGNFNFLNGMGGKNTLNVLASFTPNGPINLIGNIHVQNAGTVLTLNNPVSNLNKMGILIDPNTELRLDTNISGSGDVLNRGLLNIVSNSMIDLSAGPGRVDNRPNGVVNLEDNRLTIISDRSSAFVNRNDSTLEVDVVGVTSPGSPISNGQLKVVSSKADAVVLSKNSFIQPDVSGFIPQGQEFDIITVKGGGTIKAVLPQLVQPSSAVVFFSEELDPNNNLLLIAHRNSFGSFASTQVTQGIANALDILAQGKGPTNPTLLNLLIQLDGLDSGAAIETAMESLIPPFNYGLVAGSHIGMNSAFESVIKRLGDVRKRNVETVCNEPFNGVNNGDYVTSGSLWGKVLGAHLNQSTRKDLAGYRAKGAGLAIGGDWNANDCTTFGLAASYTKVNVDDKNVNPKDQSIKSWQGTAYGWWQFMDGLYLDAMLGIATNHYKTNRVINVNQIHTAAQARFDGTQYGAQADLGWDFIDCEDYYLAPFLRLKYIHLRLDDYQEFGAGDLSLNVQNNNLKEFLGGIGFRFAYDYECNNIRFVPELSAMIAYDFENDSEQTFAGFLGGGPTFGTNGIKPGRTIFDLGLGVNTYISCQSILTVKYNLELRSKFVGNSFYLQYNYLWS